MTARKDAVAPKDTSQDASQIRKMHADGDLALRLAQSIGQPADPGVTGDLADVVTADPAAHKTWVTLPDGQQGWVKKERKDALLVVLSIAGFDGETRWVHRDNIQDIRTA